MLFDGKRQKVLTKVIAIIAMVAFAGFGLVAGGLAVSGGCSEPTSPARQVVIDSQESVANAQAALKAAKGPDAIAQARSDLAKAQGNLASARVAADPNDPAAITDALAAVKTAPGDYDAVQTLVAVASQQNNPTAALPALAAYTSKNPKDAQAYADWGQLAEAAGQRNQAILAYQRFLVLAPDDTIAPDVRARLKELLKAPPAAG